jgi:hypothetical protein
VSPPGQDEAGAARRKACQSWHCIRTSHRQPTRIAILLGGRWRIPGAPRSGAGALTEAASAKRKTFGKSGNSVAVARISGDAKMLMQVLIYQYSARADRLEAA